MSFLFQDDEIKKVVKGILDGADLETVTMKTVVKQVIFSLKFINLKSNNFCKILSWYVSLYLSFTHSDIFRGKMKR